MGIALDNRELSFLLWGIVALILMLFKKNIRDSIFGILKTISTPNIILTNFIMLIFVSATVYFLAHLNIWDKTLLKGTLLWLIFIAFPLFFKANRANQQEHYFRNLIKENIKVIVVLEFLINLYIFPFIVEFLLVPIAVLLGGMSAVSETNKKYLLAKRVIDSIIGLLGLISIIFVLHNIISNFNTFVNYDNLKSFLLPFLFSCSALLLIIILQLPQS